MRAVYRVLGQLIAVAVVLQVASIALSGFTIAKDADDGTSIGADYSNFGQTYHSIAGMVLAAGCWPGSWSGWSSSSSSSRWSPSGCRRSESCTASTVW